MSVTLRMRRGLHCHVERACTDSCDIEEGSHCDTLDSLSTEGVQHQLLHFLEDGSQE